MTTSNSTIGAHFDQVVANLDLAEDLPAEKRPKPGPREMRRDYNRDDYSGLATLSLVETDGVLQWIYYPPARGPSMRRRRMAAMVPVDSKVIREVSFAEAPPNEIIGKLADLDRKLTPNQGLRQVRRKNDGTITLEAVPAPLKATKRILLLVHGTFSKSDMYVEEFGSISGGPESGFLERALKTYDAVLAFDHPTLSISPWINALDLEHELSKALPKFDGAIDVICHSRGGLVVAWWLHNGKRNVKNVVFAGSPLLGTSLASPRHLRNALQGLTGAFKIVEATSGVAATFMPFMAVVTGLAAVCGGILKLGANTPLADAAVAIVPGLNAQSLASTNSELDRLHRSQWISGPKYHAIVSNFDPTDVNAEWWEVWKRFARPKSKIVNALADTIFDYENDLVVDTGAMRTICGKPIDIVQDFGTSAVVHHCNYFRQRETVKEIGKALGV